MSMPYEKHQALEQQITLFKTPPLVNIFPDNLCQEVIGEDIHTTKNLFFFIKAFKLALSHKKPCELSKTTDSNIIKFQINQLD